jgi:hypothetical protein
MPVPDGAHANEPPFDQFVTAVVLWKLLQLLSRDEACGLGHRGSLDHGILASSLRGGCQSAWFRNSER